VPAIVTTSTFGPKILETSTAISFAMHYEKIDPMPSWKLVAASSLLAPSRHIRIIFLGLGQQLFLSLPPSCFFFDDFFIFWGNQFWRVKLIITFNSLLNQSTIIVKTNFFIFS
jgi:hypothetical protein